MTLASYIFPRTVARFSTKYNQDIRVVEESGKCKLLVNGSRQSGAYIEWLWKKALTAFRLGSCRSILVLGVGGGTVIHLLHKRYPQAHITAVDIDSTMIEIGKRYFALGGIPNLTLVCADAKDFVEKKTKFDLIVVDLFVGRHIPEFVRQKNFLTTLKERGSVVVINYLRELEYEEQSMNLKKALKAIFGNVRDFSIERNRFFLAQRDKDR